MSTSQAPFGQLGGQDVDIYTLSNANGMVVKITNYGGTVTSIIVPDKNGNAEDIVCGFDTLDGYFGEDYVENSPYFGCLVGRTAGQYKDGKFSLDGTDYQVSTNCGPNHLHGGTKAFDKRLWDAVISDDGDDSVLDLHLDSPDGDEGYPGNLKVHVEYRLTNQNELKMRYRAETDKATPLGMTNHTYWNLSAFKENVLNHSVQLTADEFLEVDDTGAPTGVKTSVAGTASDLNSLTRIGDCFDELPVGFEHFYTFKNEGGSLAHYATLTEPTSGRTLKVLTTEPGSLFYTGRYTSDDIKRESGAAFGQFRGLCFEASKYPNGANVEGSPNSILQPGQTLDETTIYKLSWD